MVYYLWSLHYSLVKRIYRKRFKDLKLTAWSLAFGCLLWLILFVLVLVTNKVLLWKTINSNLAIAPIGALIIALIMILLLLIYRGITSKKISILRKVIKQTKNVKHIFSAFYVSFFILLFILTIFIGISTITYHH